MYPPRIFAPLALNGPIIPFLDEPVTPEELRGCIAKAKGGKAPGVDGISAEFYKALPEDWFAYVLALFNKILVTEEVPSLWSKVTLCMLHKKGSTLDPLNYRGIALVNSVTKLFTQIIQDRLVKWANAFELIPEEQAGFRKGRGVMDNLFSLQTAIHLRLRQTGGKAYALFVDFKRAFDSVPQHKLWMKLHRIGISSKIIRILKNLYDTATLQIKTRTGLSNNAEVSAGVLQGEVLSPLLFVLYISDTVTYFQERDARGIDLDSFKDLLMLMYADDLVILAYSPIDLKRKLGILTNYCDENGLEVNTRKTQIMVFRTGGKLGKASQNFYFKGERVEIVNKYTYLGATCSSSALGLLPANTAVQKAKVATSSVLSILATAKCDSWDAIMKLFGSVVSSTVLYTASVWGLRYSSILEIARLGFFKRLFHLPRSAPSCAVRLELGLTHVTLDVVGAVYDWIIKILKMDDHRLPKICLLRLVQLANPSLRCQYNWVAQFKAALTVANGEDL